MNFIFLCITDFCPRRNHAWQFFWAYNKICLGTIAYSSLVGREDQKAVQIAVFLCFVLYQKTLICPAFSAACLHNNLYVLFAKPPTKLECQEFILK